MDTLFDGKVCTKCGEWKPFEQYAKNGSTYNGGRRADCKDCMRKDNAARKQRYAFQREMSPVNTTQKTCSQCGQSKSLELFSVDNGSPDGLQYKCKACVHAAYLERSQHYCDYQRTYRAANLCKVRARKRRYYANHREKEQQHRKASRERNMVVRADGKRRWLQRNRDKVHEYNHKRRARKLVNGGSYTSTQWQALCAHFGSVCLACGTSASLTVDHVIPLARGGSNTIDNIQPLCAFCNKSKGTQTIDYRDPVRLAVFLMDISGE